MLHHVRVVVGWQQRVDRDRHDSGKQCAEECDRQINSVLHYQQDALFAVDSACQQAGGKATHTLIQFAVGQYAVVVDVGRFPRAAGVQLEDVTGEVEALG